MSILSPITSIPIFTHTITYNYIIKHAHLSSVLTPPTTLLPIAACASQEFPCNPPTGYNTTTCNALPFATTAPDCQPVPTSPPPTTCMNGQLSAMALPVILPQCNMGEIDNMCLLCTLYRNYQIPQPSCYRLLDGSQTTWEDPTDLEYAFIVLYTVFDSALFLVAGLFAVVAIPLALKLPNEKHQRTQFMLFTLAIIWNCGSWLVHSTVHGVAEKPMPAWKWLTITIVFHWGTMLASAVIVYCMFEIITLSYAYSKSEMRTTQPGVTTQPQGMGQPDGTQTSGEWGSRDMPLDTAAALWHSADVLRDEGVGVRDNEGVGVGVNEARVAHVEMAERALHVGSDTHAHEV
ncbi:hypothetical protein SARC_13521 [Sphaeroforma arctica JP610]|uniref:Uncharacterized protein n=1 Tax=Sphaeroforma arctica JP610 TaxID=667725 RepID=A0A0L0FAY1_9EUKA|nr:hypothetical protein SARC_13521 [Sphaeroforma arctica JP610]KNC73920.1 hypothetical protein SARC_13521 [Sphaeroforma arctica JP610]|eukprot:XP_014147822.1 hypothetical protein SARC_13521 [Sphaeroforma arctica JP610]